MGDHMIRFGDLGKRNSSLVVARVVQTALFLAKESIPNISRTVICLGRTVTTWNIACDKRLHILIDPTYIIQTYLNEHVLWESR